MSFPSPDPSVIRKWGETITHKPQDASDPYDVKCIRDDVQGGGPRSNPGPLLVFFGTIQDSGFTTAPLEGDLFTVSGVDYRLYDLKTDWAGGTDDTAGLWLHLDNQQ